MGFQERPKKTTHFIYFILISRLAKNLLCSKDDLDLILWFLKLFYAIFRDVICGCPACSQGLLKYSDKVFNIWSAIHQAQLPSLYSLRLIAEFGSHKPIVF